MSSSRPLTHLASGAQRLTPAHRVSSQRTHRQSQTTEASLLMRILAIDMGTGTQDILVFDTSGPVENNVKMVMPSATEIAARRIRRATRERRPVLLTGVTMGGGPCHWALNEHLQAGVPAFATEEAARTFDDDLAVVRGMGVTV